MSAGKVVWPDDDAPAARGPTQIPASESAKTVMTTDTTQAGVAADDARVSTSGDQPLDHHHSAQWLHSALGLRPNETPFPWQEELLRRLLDGNVPSALDIPTGLGKTATMAIWLVARALGAKVPRRLVYVVDRRAVVDQATTEAERLRSWVESDAQIKCALRLERALPISTLRGQYVDNREWLEDPSAPAIVVGTVDMVGSRLLFSGYGVSRKMRPYHAGLLGVDALIVLDEAHLVPAFERLVEQIASGVDADGRTLRHAVDVGVAIPPLHFMSLSATGRERPRGIVLQLDREDRQHPVVSKRLSAKKRLSLRPAVAAKELPEVLANEAWTLTGGGASAVRVIVFCTSRDHAQKVKGALLETAKKDSIDVELFVGGRRVFEREAAAAWLAERGFIAGAEGRPQRPTFVVATAAGEVGVDLDADHAVCDLVAWERMVQRFGRVNRRGDGDARVVVVPTVHEKKVQETLAKLENGRGKVTSGADAAGGASEAESEDTAKKLKPEDRKLALRALRHDAAEAVLRQLPPSGEALDASPQGLSRLRARAIEEPELRRLIDSATTPAVLHPPLTRALVEAWSMTSLEEHTGRPEVAPWIRGWPEEEEAPQTTVVWRTHLPIDVDGRLLGKRDLETYRDAADPHLSERLETETWRVVDWIGKRIRVLLGNARVEQGDGAPPGELTARDTVAVVLDSSSTENHALRGDALQHKNDRQQLVRALSGALLLVDVRLGGLTDGLLDEDAKDIAVDVSDIDETGFGRPVPFRIRRIDGEEPLTPEPDWRIEASVPVLRTDEGEAASLVIESLVSQLAGSEEGRSGAKRAQLLDAHEEWAEADARRLATALSLFPTHTELLAASARLHDEGKKAARWQQAFNAPDGGQPPYAKTVGRPNLSHLEGYRHELGSLPFAEAHERIRKLSPELRELALHLIAAHHGAARPLIRTSGAPEPPSRLVERAREIALRFAALEKRWGPWGLAWWESVLRAADQRASRRNDLEGGGRG